MLQDVFLAAWMVQRKCLGLSGGVERRLHLMIRASAAISEGRRDAARMNIVRAESKWKLPFKPSSFCGRCPALGPHSCISIMNRSGLNLQDSAWMAIAILSLPKPKLGSSAIAHFRDLLTSVLLLRQFLEKQSKTSDHQTATVRCREGSVSPPRPPLSEWHDHWIRLELKQVPAVDRLRMTLE